MEQLPLCKCCLLLPCGRIHTHVHTHTLTHTHTFVTHQSLRAPYHVLSFIFPPFLLSVFSPSCFVSLYLCYYFRVVLSPHCRPSIFPLLLPFFPLACFLTFCLAIAVSDLSPKGLSLFKLPAFFLIFHFLPLSLFSLPTFFPCLSLSLCVCAFPLCGTMSLFLLSLPHFSFFLPPSFPALFLAIRPFFQQ